MISRFKSNEEALEVLQRNFRAFSLEKHPGAMLTFFLREAIESTFKSYYKLKVSDSMQEKLRLDILGRMRRYYGEEWVNIYGFNIKKNILMTNFQAIYKTEKGRLYGSNPGTFLDHVFYSSHCFERYKERSSCFEMNKMLILAFKRIKNTMPTAADILKLMVFNSKEYCIDGNFIYVNVFSGVVVFEVLADGLLIAKTFLTPDMDIPRKNWVFDYIACTSLDLTDKPEGFDSPIGPLVRAFPIDKPIFKKDELNEFTYAECVSFLTFQRKAFFNIT